MPMRAKLIVSATVAILVLMAACASFVGIPLSVVEGTRPVDPSQPPQTTSATLIPVKTLPPPKLEVATFTPAAPITLPAPAYQISAQVDYDRHIIQVEQVIEEGNRSAEKLTEIQVVVEPNRREGIFVLDRLQWGDGRTISTYRLDGPVLTISLEQPLLPGQTFQLLLAYHLDLKPAASLLGYTGRQLNLGDWYPFIPPYQAGTGWLVNDAAPVGEYLVYPSIDYQVEVTLLPSTLPMVVAASAPPEPVSERTTRYHLKGGRGFALSFSPEYQILQDGTVTIFYFPEHGNAAAASLLLASKAVSHFSGLFGPNPYPALSIVEGDFFDGMEYSGLFFLSADYFRDYPDSPLSYLTPLSVHESAHQWWYGQVGTDPARQPWLDEALCTYSEKLFFEWYRPDLIQWWSYYRITRYQPTGWVDASIYDHSNFRPYVDAVYLRGAQFLDDLRARVGDAVFLAFLKDLAGQYRGQILTTTDFFRILRVHSTANITDLVQKYFQYPY